MDRILGFSINTERDRNRVHALSEDGYNQELTRERIGQKSEKPINNHSTLSSIEITENAKEVTRIKQTHAYKIDLTEIEGNGDFSCPRCGNNISPDDDSEDGYSILEPKVNSQGLEELVICCNNCFSHIHLIGFSFLQKMLETTEEKLEVRKKTDTFCYIAHI